MDGAATLERCVLAAAGGGGGPQALIFDDSISACQRAEAMLNVLLQFCKHDPEAQCVLLCERRQLHSPDFADFARARQLQDDLAASEALQRIHIKYVHPPATAGALPPLVDILAALQNLPFAPTAVAVLGLAHLTSCAGAAMGSAASFGFNARPALLGTAAVDDQHFALAATLLVDAIEQAPWCPGKQHRCTALLGEVASSAETRLSLLGSIFDIVWSVRTAPRSATLVAQPLFATQQVVHVC
ncbi:unnamed protein product [Polarella glacialis]|uniref:Uncharacterized protein n=1 Tax=Polarella glacialis TaxID=89957 RepID=A0A813JTM3_POLGL|nr:unnamed protein product [Polarella glacialis]